MGWSMGPRQCGLFFAGMIKKQNDERHSMFVLLGWLKTTPLLLVAASHLTLGIVDSRTLLLVTLILLHLQKTHLKFIHPMYSIRYPPHILYISPWTLKSVQWTTIQFAITDFSSCDPHISETLSWSSDESLYHWIIDSMINCILSKLHLILGICL